MKKNLFIFVAIIFLLISIVFLWNEQGDISTRKKVNAEKLAAYGTLLASLFTAATVFLFYKQNQQQLEDRKATTFPDLYPSQVLLETHDTTVHYSEPFTEVKTLPAFTYPQFFRTNKHVPDDIHQSSKMVFCTLHNIGLGAAKQIELSWQYNPKEIKSFYEKVYGYIGIEVSGHVKTFDFIPANSSIEIAMPEDYMVCCGEQLNLWDDPRNPPKTKPELSLYIRFLDIYNNKFDKHFEIIPRCVYRSITLNFRQLDTR